MEEVNAAAIHERYDVLERIPHRPAHFEIRDAFAQEAVLLERRGADPCEIRYLLLRQYFHAFVWTQKGS